MEPVESIQWIRTEDLHANWWNPNRVMRQEFLLLEHSLLTTGWVQPILANRDLMIIDGFHRWRLSQDSPRIRERWDGRVPVSVLDVDEATAMMMTVRMNRAKGHHVAVAMSDLVKRLVNELGADPQWVADEIGAPLDEIEILLAEDIFVVRKINEWAYSKAWYPSTNDD